MKTLTSMTVVVLLLGSLTLSFGETIDEQIEAIQNAEPEQRVELVNALKTQLSTMSQEDRQAVMTQLRQSMQNNQEGDQLQVRTRLQERVNQQEATQTQIMNQNQMMNQQKAGNQAMQQGMNSLQEKMQTPMGNR